MAWIKLFSEFMRKFNFYVETFELSIDFLMYFRTFECIWHLNFHLKFLNLPCMVQINFLTMLISRNTSFTDHKYHAAHKKLIQTSLMCSYIEINFRITTRTKKIEQNCLIKNLFEPYQCNSSIVSSIIFLWKHIVLVISGIIIVKTYLFSSSRICFLSFFFCM